MVAVVGAVAVAVVVVVALAVTVALFGAASSAGLACGWLTQKRLRMRSLVTLQFTRRMAGREDGHVRCSSGT